MYKRQDEHADPTFGTGVVKITPAHDPNDFEVGNRHNLERIQIMNDDATMNENCPEKYQGMTREECREELLKDLKEAGLLLEVEPIVHEVGHSERTGVMVEPMIKKQWFVKMRPLADKVLENQKDKDTKVHFVPTRYEKTMNHWMEITYDWCISRQLWWGHRIPAYYCEDCNEMMVEENAPEKCSKCGSTHIHQDEDTLDTWFSSALWPFSTLGWPEQTEEFKYFYPTSTLVTGYDIIFFWVARMIFSGIKQTGEVPFKDVLIHGIVRDSQGRKMSKSLGNGIDPLEIISKYGADSLRFSLIYGISAGNDIRYMPEKLEQASNFANKIWNAAKFITMNCVPDEEVIKYHEDNYNRTTHTWKENSLNIEDKWIINKLNRLVGEVSTNIDNYDLGVALQKIYDFIWNEFCDWYIEMVKDRLYSENHEEKVKVCYVLDYVFGIAMKLLHPFMPFITTKIDKSLVRYNDKELSLIHI